MTSYWVRAGPKSSLTGVLVRRGKCGCRETERQKMPHEDEAEIRMMNPQTKQCRGFLATSRSKKRFFPRAFIESVALQTP